MAKWKISGSVTTITSYDFKGVDAPYKDGESANDAVQAFIDAGDFGGIHGVDETMDVEDHDVTAVLVNDDGSPFYTGEHDEPQDS